MYQKITDITMGDAITFILSNQVSETMRFVWRSEQLTYFATAETLPNFLTDETKEDDVLELWDKFNSEDLS